MFELINSLWTLFISIPLLVYELYTFKRINDYIQKQDNKKLQEAFRKQNGRE